MILFRVVEECPLCSAALSWPRPVHQLHSQESQVDGGHDKQPSQHLRRLICTSHTYRVQNNAVICSDRIQTCSIMQLCSSSLAVLNEAANGIGYPRPYDSLSPAPYPYARAGLPRSKAITAADRRFNRWPQKAQLPIHVILKKSHKHALIHCWICIVFPCSRTRAITRDSLWYLPSCHVFEAVPRICLSFISVC